MPRILDKVEQSPLPALRQTIELSEQFENCVGYFTLRGWREVDRLVERWEDGYDHCSRLKVGKQQTPQRPSLSTNSGGKYSQVCCPR